MKKLMLLATSALLMTVAVATAEAAQSYVSAETALSAQQTEMSGAIVTEGEMDRQNRKRKRKRKHTGLDDGPNHD